MSNLICFNEHVVSTTKICVIESIQYERFLVSLPKVPCLLAGLGDLECQGWSYFSRALIMVNLNELTFVEIDT